MNLNDVDLLKLQTKMMQNDMNVKGFAAALNDQFRQLAGQMDSILIYSQIDTLPGEVLDILAWQFQVDWYDVDSDIEVKRQAIKEALTVAQIRGTPAAVQRVVEIFFGDGDVEEWFDYGGQPYHFRVVTNNPSATQEQAVLLSKAVNSVKRLSTHLDSVTIRSTENMDLYEGFVLQMTDNLTLKQVV